MVIETERLLLRPFLESDAADVFEYLAEPMVNCFACMKLDSLEEARTEMKKRVGETEYYFAVVLKNTGKVIGEINGFPEHAEPHDQNEDSPLDTFSPCWMLNRAYHGKDYAYEAVHAFFDYLFREKDARRIYTYTEDYNISCQHLFARSLVCAGRGCLWNLYPLSTILMEHRVMKTHISMPF